MYFSKQYIDAYCCVDNKHIAVVQILPVLDTSPRIIYYDHCFLCLVAACKRQCIGAPPPSPTIIAELRAFMINVILPELRIIFQDFHYSYEVWYNHLTRTQQLEIDRLIDQNINYRGCCIFCKGEKQQDDIEPPKNRCISALCAQHKKVMGAVIYAMEQYIKKFKGYCGGKNWSELGDMITNWSHDAYKILQCDVSGMDRSVSMELKDLIFHSIYKIVEPYVDHVEFETWVKHAYPIKTTMNASLFVDKQSVDYGNADIIGTVFSGSCDTTFMNTLTTVIINRFVCEVKLNLSSDQYDLACKGDDSIVVVPNTLCNNTIVDAYATTYYFAKQVKSPFSPFYYEHGCGMTLKYLSISNNYDDIDFCSTNTFYCKKCAKYRLTRKIDRFIELTPWSSSMIALSEKTRDAYKQNLYLSNLKWMNGLPIFSQINNFLRTDCYTKYDLSGKPKKKLILNKIDQLWFDEMFGDNHTKFDLLRKFGKDEYYSKLNETGDIQPCCADSYRSWLEEKLNINDSQIIAICEQIADYKGDSNYSCPLLSDALYYYNNYKSSLNYSPSE